MTNKQRIEYWNIWNDHFDNKGMELDAMKSLVEFDGKKILEIGCGNGRISRLLGPLCNQLTAIDNNELMLDAAKTYNNPPNIEFHKMDALDLLFDKNTFDIVIFSWVLTCMQGYELQALTEAKKVINKRGKVLIVDFGNTSEYDDIIKPFVKESKTYGARTDNANITDLLKDIFSEPIDVIGPLSTEYKFDTESQLCEMIEFALYELHQTKVNDRENFKIHLSEYGQGYKESVLCYCAENK
jgi:ubiquinone/menaquinone biosynthesis C-methylase UbiE